ncbi:hypothetical protein J1N35_016561 [Gossypium stocksii]|uniref:RNase H type-1 domain-containing protein n=1 Tax=Gossypium stocksii TaxID=47602 RepID=A0A9D4A4B0_9ROSI|nr:hypothetical protein J1N35_016561 [Gossypium stocksii]
MGYKRFMGECSVFDAELWGIIDKLDLIQDRQYVEVMIQVDSLETVKAIQNPSSTASNSTLIRRIHQLLAINVISSFHARAYG